MSKNIVFEPTVELVKEHNPKHLRKKRNNDYREVVVSCKNGHQKLVKLALFTSKSKKNRKRYHVCSICGESLYLES